MIVYLLHYTTSSGRLWHYLGLAPSEAQIDKLDIPHGKNLKTLAAEPDNVIADVWHVEGDDRDCVQLLARLHKQGSRRRLCSVCTPGNVRGSGRGTWARTERDRERAGAIFARYRHLTPVHDAAYMRYIRTLKKGSRVNGKQTS